MTNILLEYCEVNNRIKRSVFNVSGICIDQCDPGHGAGCVRPSIKRAGYTEIYPLFGEYDLIAKVTVKDFDQLSDIVFNRIRQIKGVTDTKTLTGGKF